MMKKEADDVCPLHTLPTSKMVEKGRAGPRSPPTFCSIGHRTPVSPIDRCVKVALFSCVCSFLKA